MSPPLPDPLPVRRRPEPFRPTFTLTLLYFALFCLLYGLLLVLPALWPLLSQPTPAGSEQAVQQQASAIAREAIRGRLGVMVLAALATTGLGVWAGVLPGVKRPPGR